MEPRGGRRGGGGGRGGRSNKPVDPTVQLSKALSFLLRHGAEKGAKLSGAVSVSGWPVGSSPLLNSASDRFLLRGPSNAL